MAYRKEDKMGSHFFFVENGSEIFGRVSFTFSPGSLGTFFVGVLFGCGVVCYVVCVCSKVPRSFAIIARPLNKQENL